jgi:hypothetical protein
MKKIAIIISVIFLLPKFGQSQDKDMKKLFNQYKNVSGFELEVEDSNIEMDFDGDFDMLNFLDSVESIYILNFEFKKGKQDDLDAFKKKLEKIISKKEYKSMIDISSDEVVRILTRKKIDKTTDFLLITEGEDEAMFFWASTH